MKKRDMASSDVINLAECLDAIIKLLQSDMSEKVEFSTAALEVVLATIKEFYTEDETNE